MPDDSWIDLRANADIERALVAGGKKLAQAWHEEGGDKWRDGTAYCQAMGDYRFVAITG